MPTKLFSYVPGRMTDFTIALLAAFLFVMPVAAQAQERDDDGVTYSSPGQQSDDDDVALDDDDDNSSDDEVVPPTADDDGADDRDDDGRQDFARSEEESRCISEFRSFDPASGTYTSEDGDRIKCPYLF